MSIHARKGAVGAGLLALTLAAILSPTRLHAADEGSPMPTMPPKGRLVIIGGGAMNVEMRRQVLDLAGGPKIHVVALPQASNDPKAGTLLVDRWQAAGAEDITALDLADPTKAVETVAKADLIWIRGGSQTRLMTALKGTGVPEAIRRRFQGGGIVAGTSAGAAVMSQMMIAGVNRRAAPMQPIMAQGLGLWPDAIVDQHFLKRNREWRLKATVLEHPTLLGVGIDELTAVVVSGREFEVIGPSSVVVLDARKLAEAAKAGAPKPAATDKDAEVVKGPSDKDAPRDGADAKAADQKVAEHAAEKPKVADGALEPRRFILRAGMRYHLDKGLLPPAEAAVAREH
ncbi:MAG TPA: cyanophycinase [Isosphaeraceae bacterium]|jgi:cyanophycinase|nr:cyanophycinase [Isosphaeraceae bacterium]